MPRPLMSEKDLRDMLQALSDELRRMGAPPQELKIVGGAAIILKFRHRWSKGAPVPALTHDVDTAERLSELVRKAAELVAMKLNKPSNWLSDDSAQFVFNPVAGEILFETEHLTVRSVPVWQLLATKLEAARDDTDIDDARLLLHEIEANDRQCRGDKETVWATIERYLTPGRQRRARDQFEDIWETVHGSA